MSTVALLLIAKNWNESKCPSVGEWVHKLWYVCNNDTCVCVCVCTLSHVQLFVTPWVVAWNYLGKNTGVSCHFLLQGIFPTQGLNLYCMHLLHRQADSFPLSHLGSRYHTVKRFNMNKLWQHYAKCKKLITEDHKLYDPDYEMSKIWKSIETKRCVVAKDLGHEGGEWLQTSMGLLWGVIKTT